MSNLRRILLLRFLGLSTDVTCHKSTALLAAASLLFLGAASSSAIAADAAHWQPLERPYRASEELNQGPPVPESVPNYSNSDAENLLSVMPAQVSPPETQATPSFETAGLQLPMLFQLPLSDQEEIRTRASAGKKLNKNEPPLVGIVRELDYAQVLTDALMPIKSTNGSTAFAGVVNASDYARFRLQLEAPDLNDADVIYIRDGETLRSVSARFRDEAGRIWTPSAQGGFVEIFVERRAGAETRPELSVVAIGDLLDPTAEAQQELSCTFDSICFGTSSYPSIRDHERATAQLLYQKGSGFFDCTGTLLNDTNDNHFVFYLLTANHCFETQASASSLEATFDFGASSCGGAPPLMSQLPRTTGARLLGTSTSGDVTIVRLQSVASGERVLLGYDNRRSAVSPGTFLHRVSHPEGASARYSQTIVSSFGTCPALPVDQFLYSSPSIGNTSGGSSGGALALANGRVVGQLFGACGPNVGDNCDDDNDNVDGRLSHTWPIVGPVLRDEIAQFDLTALDIYFVSDPNDRSSRVDRPMLDQVVYPVAEYALSGDGFLATRVLSVRWNGSEVCVREGRLDPGAWFSICEEVPLTIEAGENRLQLVLDPNEVVRETNGNNNALSRTFSVEPAPRSDLKFARLYFRTDPQDGSTVTVDLVEGEAVFPTLEFSVSGAATPQMELANVTWNGQTVCSTSAAQGIGAWVLECPNAVIPQAGAGTLAVVLDPGNVLDEVDETNNGGSRTFQVAAPPVAPDVSPAEMYLVADPARPIATRMVNPRQDQEGYLAMTLNVSSEEPIDVTIDLASSFGVACRLDRSVPAGNFVSSPLVCDGDSIPLSNGLLRLVATVDPLGTVGERNEANNVSSLLVPIELPDSLFQSGFESQR